MKHRPGLTMIEVLMSLALMSIVLMGVMTLLTKGQQHFVDAGTLGDAIQASRYPLATLSRDAKMAVAVAASYGAYTTSASELVLAVPSVDGNGNIIVNATQPLTTHLDYIIYRVTGGTLERILDAKNGTSSRTDNTRLLAGNVNGLTFTYYDGDGVALASDFATAVSVGARVQIHQRGVGSRYFDQSLDSVFKLRNK